MVEVRLFCLWVATELQKKTQVFCIEQLQGQWELWVRNTVSVNIAPMENFSVEFEEKQKVSCNAFCLITKYFVLYIICTLYIYN